MSDAQHPNLPVDDDSLPFITGSQFVDYETGPKPREDLITGSHVRDDDPEVIWPPRRRVWLPWLLVGLLVAGAIAFAIEFGIPAYQQLDTLTERAEKSDAQRTQAQVKAEKLVQQLSTANESISALEARNERLNIHAAARQAQVDALTLAKTALTGRLAQRTKRGDVTMRIDGARLVITLNEATLFSDAETLSDAGKGLLGEVGAAIRELGRVEVGAHHESTMPSKLRARFATSWALTAVRASAVTQFLEVGTNIPARRLAAVGYGSSQATPARTRAARAYNRRVELQVSAPLPE